MNFFPLESLLSRQRCRQWTPLITQQLRLRHIYQIIGFNLLSEERGNFYFTLHTTIMCAPFYTSEKVNSANPKWAEIDIRSITNSAATAVVIRIWRSYEDKADEILTTWGINLSGLVYLGNKMTYIQPRYFKNNSLIFYMQGGYFASHNTIKDYFSKRIPFIDNMNLKKIDDELKVNKQWAIETKCGDVRNSYNLEKLRKLHYLQVCIKNKSSDVENLVQKIERESGSTSSSNSTEENSIVNNESPLDPSNKFRYAPQLLTMNSLNKMLQERPTKLQKQIMIKVLKEIEIYKYKSKLLSQERDKKSAKIRKLKNRLSVMTEENEERNSNLMENYHTLSKEIEKVKEMRELLIHRTEEYTYWHSQLQHRRRQLMQELLFIYPIEKVNDKKYIIHGIYLPNSDILPDCSNMGLSVALGYVTHILVMCSNFLQIPLRYPLTHYGSRSYIIDILQDKEKEYPLYTKGKDKIQFNYAVYLLNKNLAQLRWLHHMNTDNLQATLPNLLQFLQGNPAGKPPLPLPPPIPSNGKFSRFSKNILTKKRSLEDLRKNAGSPSNLSLSSEKLVSFCSYGSSPNISDPLLDCIRLENSFQRSSSPERKMDPGSRSSNKSSKTRNGGGTRECGPGLSEILAIPEAFLNKQISSTSFRNYASSEVYNNYTKGAKSTETPCGSISHSTNKKAAETNCDINIIHISSSSSSASSCCNPASLSTSHNSEPIIEQGTDPLDLLSNPGLRSNSTTKSIEIQHNSLEREKYSSPIKCKRLSRSVGSYTEDEFGVLSANLMLDSDSFITENNDKNVIKTIEDKELLNLLDGQVNAGDVVDVMAKISIGGNSTESSNPLKTRTDALLNTQSFNLVKPKQ